MIMVVFNSKVYFIKMKIKIHMVVTCYTSVTNKLQVKIIHTIDDNKK